LKEKRRKKGSILGGVEVEGTEIVEGELEKLILVGGEVVGGFGFQHFEGIDDGLGGAEVDFLFAGMGIGDLAEEKAGVLGLEDDELVEAGIGFGRGRHVAI
jgi:hypothetical protein